VCSNLNHHGVQHLTEVIETLEAHPGYTYGHVPFVMDRKDWEHAGNQLLKLLERKETEG
jgi:hypothetical protein